MLDPMHVAAADQAGAIADRSLDEHVEHVRQARQQSPTDRARAMVDLKAGLASIPKGYLEMLLAAALIRLTDTTAKG